MRVTAPKRDAVLAVLKANHGLLLTRAAIEEHAGIDSDGCRSCVSQHVRALRMLGHKIDGYRSTGGYRYRGWKKLR